MYVEDIETIKKKLSKLKDKHVIENWNLPYENLLTRLDAAIFFANISDEKNIEKVTANFDNCKIERNEEKALSDLAYRINFSTSE